MRLYYQRGGYIMMMLLVLAILLLPSLAFSQITCTQLANSLVCSGPDGQRSTITEFSRGQGVIRDSEGTITPYTIIPAPFTGQRNRTLKSVPLLPFTRQHHDAHDGTAQGFDPYGNGESVKERYSQ